jgi:hypothetical protein
MLTSAGETALLNTGKATYLYLAVGTGSTVVTKSDTALVGELDRVAATVVVVGNQLEVTALFTNSQAIGTIREVGIFTASVSGTLLQRAILATPRTKDSTRGMIVTIVETLS